MVHQKETEIEQARIMGEGLIGQGEMAGLEREVEVPDQEYEEFASTKSLPIM